MSPRPTQPVRRPRRRPGEAPAASTPAASKPAAAKPAAAKPAAAKPAAAKPAAAKPAAAKPAAAKPAAAKPAAAGPTGTGVAARRTSGAAGRPVAPRGRRPSGADTEEIPVVADVPAVLPTAPAARRATPSRPAAVPGLDRARVSTGSVRRFAERARRHRLRTWRPAALVAAVLALAVLAGWVLWFSPLLQVREVDLVGATRVTQDEVDAAVAPQLGRPLARLDAGEVRDRLEALPEVASAQVLRVWPSTVEVRVTERVPVAAVPSGRRFSLVDADGVEVERVRRAPAGLPVVSAQTVQAGDDALLAAARVLQALPDELSTQVTGTTAATPDSVTLTLASGAQVVWGSPDDSDRKAEVLQVLLATPATVYDVSAPGTPVTR